MNDKLKALQEYREKLNNGEIAPSERKTLKEKWEQKPTLRASVDYMCHQCMGGEDVVKQVRNCTSTSCALYPVRPYQ